MRFVRLFILILCSSYLIQSCKFETRNITEPVTDPIRTLHLFGQLSGVVMDPSTNTPVIGAQLSITHGEQTFRALTNNVGHYSFSNIPVSNYALVNGQAVYSGQYTVTLSCVDFNYQKPDSLRYRDYYTASTLVTFTTTAGTTQDSSVVVVQNLMANLDFSITLLNTSLNGSVVDKNNLPVPGATVLLYDATTTPYKFLKQTATDFQGIYRFSGIDNGLRISLKAVNSAQTQEAEIPAPLQLNLLQKLYILRSEVPSERLELRPVDAKRPKVITITPEYNADINQSNDFKIAVLFSEPIKQSAYTRKDLPGGHNTLIDDITLSYYGFKKSTQTLQFTAQWNTGFNLLTITPKEVLTSGRYGIDFRSALSKFVDNAGNFLQDNPEIMGDLSDELLFSINSGLQTAAVPNITINGDSLNYSGKSITITWFDYSDNNVKSFNIYKSVDNEPFQFLASTTSPLYTTLTGSLVYPQNAQNPLRSANIRYKVHAMSKDLVEGSASNILTARDNISPSVDTNSILVAAKIQNDSLRYEITLPFPEPMNAGVLTISSNYSLSAQTGLNPLISQVFYRGYLSTNDKYNLVLNITTSRGFKASEFLYITCNNITDLAGNVISPSGKRFKIRGTN